MKFKIGDRVRHTPNTPVRVVLDVKWGEGELLRLSASPDDYPWSENAWRPAKLYYLVTESEYVFWYRWVVRAPGDKDDFFITAHHLSEEVAKKEYKDRLVQPIISTCKAVRVNPK